jgi:hypothetical protein
LSWYSYALSLVPVHSRVGAGLNAKSATPLALPFDIMKKQIIGLLLVGWLGTALPVAGQQLGWQWTATMGRPGGGIIPISRGNAVIATADGGAVVSGWYDTYLALGPTRGDTLRTAGQVDGLLVKYNAAGQKQWAVTAGGTGINSLGAFAKDSQQNFFCPVEHDVSLANPGGGTLPGRGVAWFRYSASGSFQQAGELGRGSFSVAAIEADRANNFVLSGNLTGPSTIGSYQIGRANVFGDSFVAKLSIGATPLWVSELSGIGPGSGCGIWGQVLLANGDVLVGGRFNGNITLDPSHQFVASGGMGFLACYNGSTGAVRWARTVSVPVRPLVDPLNGQVYVAGEFSGQLNLDGLTPTASGIDVFIARLDATTGMAQSLVCAGGGVNDQSLQHIVCQPGGAITLSGYGQGRVSFSNDLEIVASPPMTAVQFILQIDPQGVPQLLHEVPLSAAGASLAVNAVGHPFLLANASQPVRFGQLPWVTPRGGNEIVLAHIGLVLATKAAQAQDAGLQVYPNPSQRQGAITIEGPWPKAQLRLSDVLGRLVWTGRLVQGRAILSVATLKPGLYVVQVTNGSSTVTQKLLIE